MEDLLGNEFETVEDFCDYYGIDIKDYYSMRRRKWSMYDIIASHMNGVTKKDHLGNVYQSEAEMCKHYDISIVKFRDRLNKGYSLEKALTYKGGQRKKVKDHLGNEYDSIKSMCEHYNINNVTYSNRIKYGWSLEKALTEPVGVGTCKKVKDHLGNEFDSIKSMCEKYRINQTVYNSRIKSGLTLEEALTKPVKRSSDNSYKRLEYISGVKEYAEKNYGSIVDMCAYYGITGQTLLNRLRRGMNLKQALTNDVKTMDYKDHLGYRYASLKDKCDKYGVDVKTYLNRRKRGLSLAEALTGDKYIYDHLGNRFNSVQNMVDYYGVSRSVFDYRTGRGYSLEEALTKRNPMLK